MNRARAALLSLLLATAGCSGLRTGPVERPETYPDRTDPAATWHTFLWAWKSGDLQVLAQTSAWRESARLQEELARRGPEGTAAWYREDAQDLTVQEARWTTLGESLAYLRVVLGAAAVPRVELDFSFVRRPDGWAISDRRLLR